MKKDFNTKFNTKLSSMWPYNSDEMPIIAFNPIPWSLEVILDRLPYAECKDKVLPIVLDILHRTQESGANCVLCKGSINVLEYVVEACRQLNLNVIIRIELYTHNNETVEWLNKFIVFAKDVLLKFRDEECVVGWLARDEPFYWDWGDFASGGDHLWDETIISYNMCTSLGEKAGNKRLSLFNLAVSDEIKWVGYKTDDEGLTTDVARSYDDYLNLLSIVLDAPIFSYDFYPFNRIGEVNVENNIITTHYEQFYKWLQTFRDFTNTRNKKFWPFIRCLMTDTFENGLIKTSRPYPTIGMLRFEVLNTLAFGAQGIQYYQYGLKPRMDEDDFGIHNPGSSDKIPNGTYGVASPIEYEPIIGKITSADDINKFRLIKTWDKEESIYNNVKYINSEIRELNSYFWGCKVERIMHTGKLPISDGTRAVYPGTQLQSSDDVIEYIGSDSIGVLISLIRNNDLQYIVLVNHDPFNEQDVEIIIREKYTVALSYLSPIVDESMQRENVSQYESEDPKPKSSSEVATDTRTQKHYVTLQPGGMAIFQYWG